MAHFIISRFVAKFPKSKKNHISIRYEVELSKENEFYLVKQYYYQGGNLTSFHTKDMTRKLICAKNTYKEIIHSLTEIL